MCLIAQCLPDFLTLFPHLLLLAGTSRSWQAGRQTGASRPKHSSGSAPSQRQRGKRSRTSTGGSGKAGGVRRGGSKAGTPDHHAR